MSNKCGTSLDNRLSLTLSGLSLFRLHSPFPTDLGEVYAGIVRLAIFEGHLSLLAAWVKDADRLCRSVGAYGIPFRLVHYRFSSHVSPPSLYPNAVVYAVGGSYGIRGSDSCRKSLSYTSLPG